MVTELNTIKTTHNLDFEVAPWRSSEWLVFRVGSCHGLWRSTKKAYQILAIENDSPGNGHFEDVLQWFENSCKRDGKNLMFMEVWNDELLRHLTEKRGFQKLEVRMKTATQVNAIKFIKA